jgi:hypothetical protein
MLNKFGSPPFHFLTSESAALAPESMCDYSAAILEEQQQKHILLPCHARFHKEDVQKKNSWNSMLICNLKVTAVTAQLLQ